MKIIIWNERPVRYCRSCLKIHIHCEKLAWKKCKTKVQCSRGKIEALLRMTAMRYSICTNLSVIFNVSISEF